MLSHVNVLLLSILSNGILLQSSLMLSSMPILLLILPKGLDYSRNPVWCCCWIDLLQYSPSIMASWQRVSNADSIKVAAAAAVTATIAAPAKVDAADFAKQASCYRLLIINAQSPFFFFFNESLLFGPILLLNSSICFFTVSGMKWSNALCIVFFLLTFSQQSMAICFLWLNPGSMLISYEYWSNGIDVKSCCYYYRFCQKSCYYCDPIWCKAVWTCCCYQFCQKSIIAI